MTEKELKEIRVQLYKATPLRLQLVDELIDAIKHCFSGVETNDIHFRNTKLVLGGISVRKIAIDPQELGRVLIHWYPNFNVSNQQDPYCSAYILTPKEIRKIIKTLQDVNNYYKEHIKV